MEFPSNVGAVMRAAGCYGATAVHYTDVRFSRASTYHTDTQNRQSQIQIPLMSMTSLTDDLPSTVSIVCVELAEGATPLLEFNHPRDALYIFGPEDGSIEQSIIDQTDHVVYVPTIVCMHLAATVNVLLYDRLAKASEVINHHARVIESRDSNNRLVFNRYSFQLFW